jgi:hypothetical protein
MHRTVGGVVILETIPLDRSSHMVVPRFELKTRDGALCGAAKRRWVDLDDVPLPHSQVAPG